MYHLIAAFMGFGAGAFAWSGDPIVAFLLAVCAIVWIAITTMRVPSWARPQHKPTSIVRPE